jgi:hypothetical protein
VKSPGVVIPMTAAISVAEFELVKSESGLSEPKAECGPKFSRRGKSSPELGAKIGNFATPVTVAASPSP